MKNNDEETTQSPKSDNNRRKSSKGRSKSITGHLQVPHRTSNVDNRKSTYDNATDFETAAQIRKSIARITKSELDASAVGSSDLFDAADYSLMWGSNANTIRTSSKDCNSRKSKFQDPDGETGEMLHPRSSMISFSESESESANKPDTDNTDKMLSKHLSTYGKKGKETKQGQPEVCKKPEDNTQSKSTSDKSSSSKSNKGAAAEEKKKKEARKSFESKAHDESLSLTERICLLKEESKRNPTLKERYVGHKPISGFPGCFDHTEGYPECMAPGELVRTSVNTQKLWGIPENTALTREQLIALMRHIEGHETNGNEYICLVYSLPENHPDFNPYRFKIVKYNKVPPKTGHYTLSKYGVLQFNHGMAEYTSMLQFQTQMLIYDNITKIPFFANFRLWKSFTIWRSKIKGRKMTMIRNSLADDLFITKRPLRLMLKELWKMCEKMSHMGFLKLKGGVTYLLEDFLGYESTHAKDVLERLRAFEGMVFEMTSAACRATLIEEGFSPDSYGQEMNYYMEQLEQPVHSKSKPFLVSEYPGPWLTYSQQLKKRHTCRRLTDFIRLVDYYVQRTYFQIMKNSMVYLMLEMNERVQFVPDEFFIPVPYLDELEELISRHEKHGGHMILSASNDPLYDVGCSWTDDKLVFSPSVSDYIKGFRFLFYTWKKTIMSYQNMLSRAEFHPYTQPIINGYVDEKTSGDGPNMELLIQNDPELADVADVLQSIIHHGFHVCDKYIKVFDHIRLFCQENQKVDLETYKAETDVRVFVKLLEQFADQMETLNHTEEIQNMGVFRVNNSIIKAHAIPTIVRCLDVLQKHFPEYCPGHVIKKLELLPSALESMDGLKVLISELSKGIPEVDP